MNSGHFLSSLLLASTLLVAMDVDAGARGRLLVVNNCAHAVRLVMLDPGGTNTLTVAAKVTGVWSLNGEPVMAELPREVFVEAVDHRFVILADQVGSDGYARLVFDDEMIRQAIEAARPQSTTPAPSSATKVMRQAEQKSQGLPKALVRGRAWTVKGKRLFAAVVGLEAGGKVRLRQESGTVMSALVTDMAVVDELFLKRHATDWLKQQGVRLPSEQRGKSARLRYVRRRPTEGVSNPGSGFFGPSGRPAPKPNLKPMPTAGTIDNTGKMLTLIGATLASRFAEGHSRDAVPQTRDGVELVSLTPKQSSTSRTIHEVHERYDPLLKVNVHTPVERTVWSYDRPSVVAKLKNTTSRTREVSLQLFLVHDHVVSILAATGEYVDMTVKVPVGKTVEVAATAARWNSSYGLKKRIRITRFDVR